jgi:hypothetical protein
VTSDWLCLGREVALGPAINIVASLSVPRCASLAWPSEWEPWLLDFCFCSALTGVVHWSVLDSLVRGVFGAFSDDPLAHTLGSWEVRSRHGALLCSLPAASDVTTAHTTIWGCGRCIPLLV